MALITLRAADEIRPAEFGISETEIDPEEVAIARMIIERRAGHFDPATFRDRYQDALRELIEARMKGLRVKLQSVAAPSPVLDLMTALKRSLEQETNESGRKTKRNAAGDRRQRNLLLPVSGKGSKKPEANVTAAASKRQNR
jgi:DNA end-binding protein Ku